MMPELTAGHHPPELDVFTSLNINSAPSLHESSVVPSERHAGPHPTLAHDTAEVGRIYVVLELAGQLKVKSVPVSKESAKALFLGDSILLPGTQQPKRLMIKGLDPIARTEKEAVEHYITYLHHRVKELEAEQRQTRNLIKVATDFIQVL
jgi:hypothetical protein